MNIHEKVENYITYKNVRKFVIDGALPVGQHQFEDSVIMFDT